MASLICIPCVVAMFLMVSVSPLIIGVRMCVIRLVVVGMVDKCCRALGMSILFLLGVGIVAVFVVLGVGVWWCEVLVVGLVLRVQLWSVPMGALYLVWHFGHLYLLRVVVTLVFLIWISLWMAVWFG